MSSCEAEYSNFIWGLSSTVEWDVVWRFEIHESRKMKLLVNNKSTIDLAKYSIIHERNKHIKMRLYIFKKANKK